MADNGGNGNVDRYARSTAWFIERVGFERFLILILVAGVGYLLIWQLPAREDRFNDSIAAHDKLFTDALAQHDNRIIAAIPDLASKAATDTVEKFEQMRMWKESDENFELEQKERENVALRQENRKLKVDSIRASLQAKHFHREADRVSKDVTKHATVAFMPYGVDAKAVKPEPAHQNREHNDKLPSYESLPGNETGMGRPPTAGPPTVGAIIEGVTGAIGATVP